MWWRSSVIIFLVGGLLVAQQGPVEKGLVVHGTGARMSIFDPVADQYVEEVSIPGTPAACLAWPSAHSADRLIIGQSGGELLSVDINTHTIIGISDLTAPLEAVTRVDTGVFQDHLAVIGQNPVQTSNSASVLMLVHPVTLTEYPFGVFGSGSTATSWKAIEFSHTTNNDTDPTNDTLRYWLFDDGANGGLPRISYVNLPYANTLQGNGNPFNPNPNTPGPGYPNLFVQLDQNPNTMLDLASLPNHVENCQLLRWFEPVTATNYIFSVDSWECLPGVFCIRIGIINADTATLVATTTVGNAYTEPPFLAADVADDYIVLSEGISDPGSGGNVARFVHLPSLIGGGTPVKASHFLTGIYGVKANLDHSKVYFGTDETDDRVVALPVDLTHPTTPVTGAEISFNLLTEAESNQLNGPSRRFPLCFSFIRTAGGAFAGGGGAGSGHGHGGSCSASSGLGIGFAVLFVGLLVGLGVLRKLLPPAAR